ncbi:MAG: hypothetical protein WCH85_00720 [Methanomicrobiales archaeon]
MAEQQERALSETMAVILIAILVIIAAVLITALLTGVMTKMLQKPALFAVQTTQFDTTDVVPAHIISLSHLQGDNVILNGTSQSDGVSIISLSLISPAGGTVPLRSLVSIKKSAWQPGDILYVYQSGGSYGFSDVAPTGVASLAPGNWTIRIQDDKIHVLLHTLPVTIKS